MASPKDERKRLQALVDEEDERGGAQGGTIEFQDFLSTGSTVLSPEEEKKKLAEHKEKNSDLVDKQKKRRDDREQIKTGKTVGYQQGGYGYGKSGSSSYEEHPIVGKAAEFDGADPQMSLDPNANEAETNAEKKQELTYQYQLKNQLVNQSTFVPPKPMV